MHPYHPTHIHQIHEERRHQLEGRAQHRRLLRMLRRSERTSNSVDQMATPPVRFPGGGSAETAGVVDRAA